MNNTSPLQETRREKKMKLNVDKRKSCTNKYAAIPTA